MFSIIFGLGSLPIPESMGYLLAQLFINSFHFKVKHQRSLSTLNSGKRGESSEWILGLNFQK